MDNLSTKNGCQKCRECCKFEQDEIYFAPLFTEEEVNTIGKTKINFKKKSENVFQIQLKKSNNYYICPFLNENTHLCNIYEKRPFDCRIWPFIVMKKDNKTVLACFDKDLCPDMDIKTDKEFQTLKDEIIKYIDIDLIRRHPGLVWDYEEDTFIIKELK